MHTVLTRHFSRYREGLMSYKQFNQELEDDILPSEAERRYIIDICAESLFCLVCDLKR